MSKLFALGAALALAMSTLTPASANYAGAASAASVNRAGSDKQDLFKLNRLRADGSSLVLSQSHATAPSNATAVA